MYLMFSDDSGDARNRWRVVTGICLSEEDSFKLKNYISETKVKYDIDAREELKPLNRQYEFVRLSKDRAEELTFSTYDFLNSLSTLKIYGVFFLNEYLKTKFNRDHQRINSYCYIEACEALYNRFDMLLAQSSYPPSIGEQENPIPKYGIVVLDEPSSRLSRRDYRKMQNISAHGTGYRPSSLIFWGVALTSSESNFGIEVAGFVAFALRKAINNDNLAFVNTFKKNINRTSAGYINNHGAIFFDGNKGRNRLSREERKHLLQETCGSEFLNLIYNEDI